MSQTDPDYDVPCDQACDTCKTALAAYDELRAASQRSLERNFEAHLFMMQIVHASGDNAAQVARMMLDRYGEEPDPLVAACADALAEIKRAKAKHGPNFISELDDIFASEDPVTLRAEQLMYGFIGQAGDIARTLCDNGHASRIAVLVEEVDEVRQALVEATDPGPELTQVAAMAVAWNAATRSEVAS